MISESTSGLSAGEWFESLPTDADRRTVTGIVATANEFNQGIDLTDWNAPTRRSENWGYLAVYAIGSRARMEDRPDSDVDILVAHNLWFESPSRYSHTKLDPWPGIDWKDYSDDQEAIAIRAGTFRDSLSSDSVSLAVAVAIASSGESYRIPNTFDGSLPPGYEDGGKDHKAMARYGRGSSQTALDMIFYRGLHHYTEPRPWGPRRDCGPKCQAAGFNEDGSPEVFEGLIDTDNDGNPLDRVPLFTYANGKHTIYVPQIVELVQVEQGNINSSGIWSATRSWTVSPLCSG